MMDMNKRKKHSLTKLSVLDRAFVIVNTILLTIVLIVTIYPFYYTIIASFSDAYSVVKGQVILLPKNFTLDIYLNIFKSQEIWTGYRNTIFYTAFGTLWNLFLLIPCAYAMTKKGLKGRTIIMGIFVFTMYFGGGMIPYYMLIKSLKLINNPLVMVIPGGISVYSMIVTRTFFQSSIPDNLLEAARIDGAGEFLVFFRIVLPVSGAIIAVQALFAAVGHWNSFYNALLYINETKYYPLQLVLRNILILNQSLNVNIETATIQEIAAAQKRAYMAETMKYGIIIIASLPVLVAYPFIQKYFVKGVMIGSLKG